MTDSDDRSTQQRLTALHTNGTWECIECVSNSFQRVRILAALNDTHIDLRDLKDKLVIPRTTLQRNLSLLEQRSWIKQTSSGYTTTIRGSLLTNIFLEMLREVQRIEILTPFLNEVDQLATLDIDRLNVSLVTIPEPHRPHAPIVRLFDIFETATHIRAFSPVVTGLLSKHYDRSGATTREHEFIFSKNAVDAHYRTGTDNWSDEIKPEQNTRIDVQIYDGGFPYGLFVCEETVALAAYDGVGRIQALVESESETTISWGKQVYETYKHQSCRLRETDILRLIHDLGREN